MIIRGMVLPRISYRIVFGLVNTDGIVFLFFGTADKMPRFDLFSLSRQKFYAFSQISSKPICSIFFSKICGIFRYFSVISFYHRVKILVRKEKDGFFGKRRAFRSNEKERLL